MAERRNVSLNTTLSVEAFAALSALATREGEGEAKVVISSLVRGRLEELLPGSWDRLLARAANPPPEESPRDRAAELSGYVLDMLAAGRR